MNSKLKNENVLYPELSYQLVGAAFRVCNELGLGQKEKYYQRAFAAELQKLGLNFIREQIVNLIYDSQIIGKYILDFVVENKIVVELKVRPQLGYTHVRQVRAYLKNTSLKLAILIYFTKDGVKQRRIINSDV